MRLGRICFCSMKAQDSIGDVENEIQFQEELQASELGSPPPKRNRGTADGEGSQLGRLIR